MLSRRRGIVPYGELVRLSTVSLSRPLRLLPEMRLSRLLYEIFNDDERLQRKCLYLRLCLVEH